MTTRLEQAGIYGFVNGLGYRGDRATKQALIRSAQRAANRGDWDRVVKLGLAYIFGTAAGSYVRGASRSTNEPAGWPVQ